VYSQHLLLLILMARTRHIGGEIDYDTKLKQTIK